MLKTSLFSLVVLVLLVGCTSKDEVYTNAVQNQYKSYLEAYNTVENKSIEFEGTFDGKIKMVEPKKLPQMARIERAKSGSEVALEWTRTLAPVALGVAGFHYNFKTADSSNKYNAESIGAWTGNFENSNSVITTTDTNSNTLSNTSTTDNVSTDNSNTQTTTPITIDSNGTLIGD